MLDQVIDLLKQRGRASYRALRLQFSLEDEHLEVLKEELIDVQRLAVDQDGRMLIWAGEKEVGPELAPPPTAQPTEASTREPRSYTPPHLVEKILQSKSALEGERKQVSVLFCDLQNSTPLAESIGPEAMHALLNRFFELALGEVHRYEGVINQFLGDGFMALFGAPIAHEDHARRAVLAAIGLQRRLQDTNPGEPNGVACAFRMGINSGFVVVGSIGDNLRMDYSAIGDTTNLAARLQTRAEPDDILVSGATARWVEGEIQLEALEPVEIKGKAEPVSIYKVVGSLPRRSPIVSRSERTLSRFVGRARELATLEALLEQVASGNGQVVGLVAEAGQGKSRLLYEFRQRVAGKVITYFEGRCLSYGSSMPYHPILDVVRHHCGINDADSTDAIIEKVGIALQDARMAVEASAPYLLRLLGVQKDAESISMLTPEAVKTRTFDTLRQISVSVAQQGPLIYEVEDLHWLDQTSEAYLASLVDSLPGASIMLLTTYRPGYQPPWLGKSYATQISLPHLAPPDALTIVHSAHPDIAIPEELAQTIVTKAEGNPFFLEELTRAVMEYGDFQAGMRTPDTIQGVLSARIDRLPEMHKRLLQTASVLGREFSSRLLSEIWDGPGALDGLLSELKQLEFLFDRTGAEDTVYVFKHALTQDVAYESLLTTRRQALHAAAARALELLNAGRLEDIYDHLAYHYARTDDADKAVTYLKLTAERAMRGYAHVEASEMLRAALLSAQSLPDTERDHRVVELVTLLAESLFLLGHRQEAVSLLLEHQALLETIQYPYYSSRYYVWLGHAYAYLGMRELAVQNGRRSLEEAERDGDNTALGRAYTMLGQEAFFSGSIQNAATYCQRACDLLQPTQEYYWLGLAFMNLGLCSAFSGAFSRAAEVFFQLENLAQTAGEQRLQNNAILAQGWNYAMQGEGETGITHCQRALNDAPDAFEAAFARGLLGYAYLEAGDISKTISVLEKAVTQADQYRSKQVQSWFRSYLGEAYRLSGHIEKAQDVACQALALAQDIQNPLGTTQAQRTLGRIAHSQRNFSQAESYLHQALHTARTIQARYELARTHFDIASLAHTQHDPYTATTHLSAAYTWFQKLQVSKWVERTEQLAQEYGVALAEVELDDLTEGSL